MTVEAKKGKVQAAKLVLDLIRFASDLPEGNDDNPDEVLDPKRKPIE